MIKAIHIVGIVFWLGGLLVISRMLKFRLDFEYEKFTLMIKKIYFSFLVPGFLITLVTGIINLSENSGIYFKQGWFHGKLTLVLFLIGCTIQLYRELRKTQSSRAILGAIHGITALCLFLIPLFTYLKF